MEYPTVTLRRVIINLRGLYNSLNDPLEPISLGDAAITIGYNSITNGSARAFMQSAQQYGLIEFSVKDFNFKFTPFAADVFSDPVDPIKLKQAASLPPLFKKLFDQLNGDVKVYRTTVHSMMAQFPLTANQRHIAGTTFFGTVEYLRSVTSIDATEKLSLHSNDARISIFYAPGLKKKDLIYFLEDCEIE